MSIQYNWLVAVDETDVASFAFNYAVSKMDKKSDHLYIMNVHDEPSFLYGGYTTPEVLSSLNDASERKSKKVLVHFGHRAKEAGVAHFTLMKGSSSHSGELLCRAVKQYNIHNVLVGRRNLSGVQRFFSGSTSQYVVENAEANVIVVKLPPGAEEEHSDKSKVIQMEEEERIRRVQEDSKMNQLEAEASKKDLEQVHQAEEAERARRIAETKDQSLDQLIHVFAFHDELKQKVNH